MLLVAKFSLFIFDLTHYLHIITTAAMRYFILAFIILSMASLLLYNVYSSDVAALHPSNDILVVEVASSEPADGSVVSTDVESPIVETVTEVAPQVRERGVMVEVGAGETLTNILARYNVGASERYALSRALKPYFDPRRLRPGRKVELVLAEEPYANGNRCLKYFRIMVGHGELVELAHVDNKTFKGERIAYQYDTTVKEAAGTIDSSFFSAARNQGVPRGIFTEFYNMLGAKVDFQRDIKPGDSFHIVYEEEDDTPYDSTNMGRLLYASMTMSGKSVGYFRYTTHDGFTGFFDEQGNSIDTQLLRTPLRAGNLSSPFGNRKHPVYGYQRMHQGIDFSARRGTAVLAAGDGVIDRVGRYGTYGKYIRVRHGEKYMTAYAHLAGYAKNLKVGTRVSQGDVIGYVGSTGVATGPNLHYEVLRYGKRINPLKLKLPPIKSLSGEELRRFQEFLKAYEKPLDTQPLQVAQVSG